MDLFTSNKRIEQMKKEFKSKPVVKSLRELSKEAELKFLDQKNKIIKAEIEVLEMKKVLQDLKSKLKEAKENEKASRNKS